MRDIQIFIHLSMRYIKKESNLEYEKKIVF